jgi:hypothetical protein
MLLFGQWYTRALTSEIALAPKPQTQTLRKAYPVALLAAPSRVVRVSHNFVTCICHIKSLEVGAKYEASRHKLSHFASFKVPAQAKFGTLERLKRDKSAAKLHVGPCPADLRSAKPLLLLRRELQHKLSQSFM